MRADGLDDFFPGGVWIGLQEYLGPHEETGSTETALHGSPVDERHAERPPERFRQAFECDNVAVGYLAHGGGAGEARLAVQFHKAGSAGRLTGAAVLGRREVAVIAEIGKERNGWIAVIRRGLPVESERDHGISPARHWIVRGGNLLKNASLPAPPPLQKLLTGGEETHREFSFYLWFIRLCPHSAK